MRRKLIKSSVVVLQPEMAITVDFFFILFLFGLPSRDFSLKLMPMQLCCSLYVVVAANLVFRQLVTNTNTAISTTQCHTMSLVLLIHAPTPGYNALRFQVFFLISLTFGVSPIILRPTVYPSHWDKYLALGCFHTLVKTIKMKKKYGSH